MLILSQETLLDEMLLNDEVVIDQTSLPRRGPINETLIESLRAYRGISLDKKNVIHNGNECICTDASIPSFSIFSQNPLALFHPNLRIYRSN